MMLLGISVLRAQAPPDLCPQLLSTPGPRDTWTPGLPWHGPEISSEDVVMPSTAGGDTEAAENCVLGGLDSNSSRLCAAPRAEVRAPSSPAQPPATGHLLRERGISSAGQRVGPRGDGGWEGSGKPYVAGAIPTPTPQ